jgi:ketosteroid isomerase-like protein
MLPGMDDTERLRIERECERLVTAYCHHVDHGEAERVAELFSEDGVWRSPEVSLEGREQIHKAFARRQAMVERTSRHVCTNLLVNVIDADCAEGVVYLTLWRHDGEPGRVAPLEQPELLGEYRDRFVRTPEGWRFAQREIAVSFLRRAPS